MSNDLDACPIIFLYRHALELYLKGAIRTGTKILHLLGNIPPDLKSLEGHHLTSLLPAVKQIFNAIGETWETDINGLRTFDEFKMLVEELDEADPGSYSFRYPIGKGKRPQGTVPHHFVFNVIEFAHQMNQLLSLLDGVNTFLEEEWNVRAEAAYEAQQASE